MTFCPLCQFSGRILQIPGAHALSSLVPTTNQIALFIPIFLLSVNPRNLLPIPGPLTSWFCETYRKSSDIQLNYIYVSPYLYSSCCERISFD